MIKNIKKIVFAVLLSALFFYTVYFQLYTHDYVGYRERWLQCLDYLEQGTFWSGQPYCDGGPLVYYLAYIVHFRSGIEYFQYAMVILNTLLSASVLYFTYKIYKKETGRTNKFFIVVLYGFLAYANAVTEFETVLMGFFIFLAYYFLFYTEYRQKEWYAGLFSAGAMLTKFNALVFLGFIGICYLYQQIIVQKEKKKWWNGIKILLPTAVLYIIFKIKYEHFFIYLFLTQLKQTIALSIPKTLSLLLFPGFNKAIINIIPLYILVLLCWYQLYREIKERNIKTYTFIAAIGLPALIFLIVKSFGIGFATDFRYWFPVQPFVILSVVRLYDALKTDKTKILQKALFTAGIATIIIFPGAYYSPLTHLSSPLNMIVKLHPFTKEKYAIMTKLNYGYSIIPEQDGKVLVEWGQPHYIDELYAQFNISIPRERLFSITNTMAPTHPDVWQFPRFQELLGEKLLYDMQADEGLTTEEENLIKEIENETYSLIIFGQPNWFVTNRILNVLIESNKKVKDYCGVEVPSNVWLVREGLQITTFFFKNPEDCDKMIRELYLYYNQNLGFEEICRIDKELSEVVKMAMEKNGAPIDKTCVGGGEEVLPFLKENIIIKKWQLWGMLLLIFLCLIYYLPAMMEDEEGIEKQKEDGEINKNADKK